MVYGEALFVGWVGSQNRTATKKQPLFLFNYQKFKNIRVLILKKQRSLTSSIEAETGHRFTVFC